MSGFRRGPNVSQYIANLNSISSAQQESWIPENGAIDEELASFANTELFDFDLTNEGHQQDFNNATEASKNVSSNAPNAEFNATYNNFFDPAQQLHLDTTDFSAANNFDPQLFQSPQSATFPAQQQPVLASRQPQNQQEQDLSATDSAAGAAAAGQNAVAGVKRSQSVASPSNSVEDVARMAAEEDKRRRNTAASARFRIKKKQREAALEKTAKEMTDKVEALQKRVSELEMENKWLRGLVVEKGVSVKKEDSEQSNDSDVTVERIPGQQVKKGVGTKSELA